MGPPRLLWRIPDLLQIPSQHRLHGLALGYLLDRVVGSLHPLVNRDVGRTAFRQGVPPHAPHHGILFGGVGTFHVELVEDVLGGGVESGCDNWGRDRAVVRALCGDTAAVLEFTTGYGCGDCVEWGEFGRCRVSCCDVSVGEAGGVCVGCEDARADCSWDVDGSGCVDEVEGAAEEGEGVG